MRTPTRHLTISPTPLRDARARRTQRLVFLPAMILLVGGMGAFGFRSLLPHLGPISRTPAAGMAGALSESEARRRAAALCSRVAGPNAVASNATLLVVHPGHDRPSRANWQVDCQADGGAYSVRLDARTGELQAIGREPREDSPAGGEGDARATAALTAARAAAFARRYLKLVGIAPLPEAHPEVCRTQGRQCRGYACTFRSIPSRGQGAPTQPAPGGNNGLPAGDNPSGTPLIVRVDIDARDGSLDALFRQIAAPR